MNKPLETQPITSKDHGRGGTKLFPLPQLFQGEVFNSYPGHLPTYLFFLVDFLGKTNLPTYFFSFWKWLLSTTSRKTSNTSFEGPHFPTMEIVFLSSYDCIECLISFSTRCKTSTRCSYRNLLGYLRTYYLQLQLICPSWILGLWGPSMMETLRPAAI